MHVEFDNGKRYQTGDMGKQDVSRIHLLYSVLKEKNMKVLMQRKHGSIRVGCYKRDKDSVGLNQALVWRSVTVYEKSVTYDSLFKIQGQGWTP